MRYRRYVVGERVRVNRGVRSADYPELALGGWVGTVIEVHGYDTYTVRWCEETLDRIDVFIRHRMERDGLDLETYDIAGDELEADSNVGREA